MNESNELFNKILEEIKQELEDDSRIEISKDNGYLRLKLVKISNTNIKNKIANYKRNLDLLDDCIFVDVLDELPTYNIDLKQFDELLNKEELTEPEEIYVSYLIDFTNSLIRQHIANKIEDLNELIDNF